MDLGATVCVPRTPVCDSCPLQELCQARKEGLAELLPVARKQKKIPVRQQIALLIKRSGRLLLRQRPTDGFLGGLWEFPAVELSTDQQPRQAAECLLSDLGLSGALSEVGEVRHAYSHFKLELSVLEVEVDVVEAVVEDDPGRWFTREEMGGLPLHGAHRKVSDQFANTC
jgi:A/G-specific adenine glycosylase